MTTSEPYRRAARGSHGAAACSWGPRMEGALKEARGPRSSDAASHAASSAPSCGSCSTTRGSPDPVASCNTTHTLQHTLPPSHHLTTRKAHSLTRSLTHAQHYLTTTKAQSLTRSHAHSITSKPHTHLATSYDTSSLTQPLIPTHSLSKAEQQQLRRFL